MVHPLGYKRSPSQAWLAWVVLQPTLTIVEGENHMTDLEKELAQHRGGADHWYRHPLFRKYVYTSGIKTLADKGQAYWLLDFIFSRQSNVKIKGADFQVWTIAVKDDRTATLTVEDGNNEKIKQFRLDYTDFPLKAFTVWFIGNTLLLPCEY